MQTITLNNDVTMPQLGFGVWQVPDDEAYESVQRALASGYRSIDTARIYANESGVGRAIADSDVSRDDLFVTTKLWNADQGYDSTLRAFDDSLARLGLEQLDLYLIHWPMPGRGKYVESWKAMERLLAEGRTRAIGVSNFTAETLETLTAESDTVPVLNQIELHPYLSQPAMRSANANLGIATEAWSPLGQGKGLLEDPVLSDLAAKHGKSPAQVALRWHLQLGNIVIPKSVTPSRIAENIDVFDFTLDDDDMRRVSGLDEEKRYGADPATMEWIG